jgi:hypothetical protein
VLSRAPSLPRRRRVLGGILCVSDKRNLRQPRLGWLGWSKRNGAKKLTAAVKILTELEDSARTLTRMPLRGRLVSELAEIGFKNIENSFALHGESSTASPAIPFTSEPFWIAAAIWRTSCSTVLLGESLALLVELISSSVLYRSFGKQSNPTFSPKPGAENSCQGSNGNRPINRQSTNQSMLNIMAVEGDQM